MAFHLVRTSETTENHLGCNGEVSYRMASPDARAEPSVSENSAYNNLKTISSVVSDTQHLHVPGIC